MNKVNSCLHYNNVFTIFGRFKRFDLVGGSDNVEGVFLIAVIEASPRVGLIMQDRE